MELFDKTVRNDRRYIQAEEPEYTFFNREAGVEFDSIRDLCEQWFSRYPAEHKNDLLHDFRAKHNHQHQGAFFELFVHELLLRLGCSVTVHPELEHTTRRVDFLAETPDGQRFYVEAVLATDDPAWRRAQRVSRIRPQDAIRRKLKDKAKRYGKLNHPYIIALNTLGPFANGESMMEALFGDELIIAHPTLDGGFVHVPELRPNGLWHNHYSPDTGSVSNTRVSAVLIADQMSPGNVASSPHSSTHGYCPRLRLYHNPWAEHKYSSILTRLPQACPRDGQMVMFEGEALPDIFGLPLEWPFTSAVAR